MISTLCCTPASAFVNPMQVFRDPDLTLNEKRAILSSWASDACAVEAAPSLHVSTSCNVVHWDDIMDALRTLDRDAENCGKPLPHYKRVLARSTGSLAARKPSRRNRNDEGAPLN